MILNTFLLTDPVFNLQLVTPKSDGFISKLATNVWETNGDKNRLLFTSS